MRALAAAVAFVVGAGVATGCGNRPRGFAEGD
jgi:hypothetical protein